MNELFIYREHPSVDAPDVIRFNLFGLVTLDAEERVDAGRVDRSAVVHRSECEPDLVGALVVYSTLVEAILDITGGSAVLTYVKSCNDRVAIAVNLVVATPECHGVTRMMTPAGPSRSVSIRMRENFFLACSMSRPFSE